MGSYSKSIRLIVMLTMLVCWSGTSSAQVSGVEFLEEWSVAPSISEEVTAGSTESDEFIGEMGPWQAEASTTEWCGETTATASYSIDPGAVSILAKMFRPNESARSEIIHFPLASPITVSAENPAFLEVDFDSATIDVFQNVYSPGMYYWLSGAAVVKIELRDSQESPYSGLSLRLSRWRGTTWWGDIGSHWEWRPEQVVAGSPLNLVDYLAPGRVLTIDSVSVYADVWCNYQYHDRWKHTYDRIPAPDSWQFEATAQLNNLRSIRIFKPVVAPTVYTLPATDVTKSSATLNGILTDDGGEACQYRFRYRDGKGSYIYTPWTGSATTGELFSQAISDLNPNTTYYFNAQAKNSAGESAWGNEQSFVARTPEPPVVDLLSAFMISPYELYISMIVTFPKDTPEESNKKVDLWMNVNGVDISKTCVILSLNSNKTAEISYMVDFRDERDKPQPVPRFTDNVNFTVYGKAYWEGGQYSEVASTEVRIPLPVIIIHGYTLTHRAVGEVIDSFKMLAYNQIINQLKKNGYTYAREYPDLYVTLWGPEDCEYQADKVTESDIYSVVNSWILRAMDKSYADRVNIIGHCFGGLVARYYCGEQYTSGLPSNVNKVIMIGTPHLGVTEFYIWAFEYNTKEDADRVLKKPGTNDKNLLLWGEPQYGVSCLLDVTTGTPAWVPEPYESSFNPDDNPNVQYYSIYANNHEDTPYKLYVKQEGLDWYSVVSYPIPMSGDGTVLDFSASAFADDPPPIGSGNHVFLCNQPDVIKRVLEILSSM